MTDQIYYKLQYPLKKAINMIKQVDPEDPFAGSRSQGINREDLEEIGNFLKMWEKEGKNNLQRVIRRLRKKQ